ncbi:hypothetical protein Ptr902_11470 [Pyrenophora tritici-repentis]|uniref:Uncharacterized protein n=2 Tax=Pyrenophora tritici-repentis TaxID=45151 RepID=A0A5M9L0D2_9PLEO|nr:uncharacterized protein PTRG_07940 [Pyrenophora tritici-repentis Pt-1C-BFP]KAA8616715.1 hypothetical protein PtrV1_10016 [Pyrenophora tritici-repentis]EDU50859.1 predicted protein [Pyrenophora tritici-repentis Pt-1C-BFP]KAI1515660.1 hypothetical protein Ptr86124_005661 [Pyrenophora tritici-repentis]KAI1664539.1 hypothetical protein L13192_11723 [Pyrenophora tritici-repentis]KAI1678648.1 hypothetical protein KJE20_12256 [Pyrenophora tritici-repentis]
MVALEDAKVLPQTVTLGIWWKESTRLDGLSSEEVEKLKIAVLTQLKKAITPVQVVCRGAL